MFRRFVVADRSSVGMPSVRPLCGPPGCCNRNRCNRNRCNRSCCNRRCGPHCCDNRTEALESRRHLAPRHFRRATNLWDRSDKHPGPLSRHRGGPRTAVQRQGGVGGDTGMGLGKRRCYEIHTSVMYSSANAIMQGYFFAFAILSTIEISDPCFLGLHYYGTSPTRTE